MSDQSPLYSIIIPTYNRREYLKKAVDSVLAQTFEDFELIIIDDGSTDGTDDLITQYSDSRISCTKQSNHGVAHARNRGLEKATGHFIAFLDSDDWWMPQKLERFKEVIEQFPSIQIFHSEEIWYQKGKRHNPKEKHQKPDGFVYRSALPLCCISISTAVVHQSIFDDIGCFDESLSACEDYDFWLRATSRFPVKLIPEYLTEKEGGREDQLSSQWGLDRYRIKSLAKMLRSGTLNREYYEATYLEMMKKAKVYINGCQKRRKNKEAMEFTRLMDSFKEPFHKMCYH